MSLVMYLYRAPKYQNTTAKEIKLIESYLEWQKEKEKNSKYNCDTFEKWCNHSENELPNKDVIDFYKSYYDRKEVYMETIGNAHAYSIFEQLARFVKTNPIFNWFYNNIMSQKFDREYHKVTKEQLERFLDTCEKVREGIVLIKENEYKIPEMDEYKIDENLAKNLLPTYDNEQIYFGPNQYGGLYAFWIINASNVVRNILNTTDFEKQTIYLNFTSTIG